MDATIHIDNQLFLRVQQTAQATGQTVDAVISNALIQTLMEQPASSSGRKYCFPRDCGMGLKPGVNLNNNAELRDLMEEGLDVSHRR